MNIKTVRRMTFATAFLATALVVTEASAQCCGGGGYTSSYPSYSTSYYPSYNTSYYGGYNTSYYGGGYATNYSGWYPGYYWDRARARLWGSPTTYVASYPSTYAVGYSGYATSYAPSYSGCSSCGTCSSCSSGTYSAGYSGCSTCASPCTTCYAPSCGCDACSSGYSASTATQASYQQPGCCGTQTMSTTTSSGSSNGSLEPEPAPQTYRGTTSEAPSVAPSDDVPAQRDVQRPATEGTEPNATPGPGSDSGTETNSFDPYDPKNNTNGNNSTYFEAPKLFNPKDRTAQRSIAPVRTAVYEQPVSYQRVSTAPQTTITQQQFEQDAAGWSSVSN